MLEAKYYRDYRHNYMILQCRYKEMARSYQYKILTSGKLGDILRCSVRHINGDTYYYYDISSRTTLQNLYQGKKMTCIQLKDILCQLHGICDRLSGYFMDEMGLVLLPEHIYYDLTDGKYIGLYYPDYNPAAGEMYGPLMDFLLDHIDTEDQHLTESMYRIYEAAQEPHFCMENALQILEECEEAVSQPYQEPKNDTAAESACAPDEAVLYESVCQTASLMEDYDRPGDPDIPQKRSSVSGTGKKFYYVLTVLSMLGMAGAVSVYNLYELTREEELAIYVVLAGMGICLLGSLFMAHRGNRKSSAEQSKAEPANKASYTDARDKTGTEFRSEPRQVSLENVISRDMDLELAQYGKMCDHLSQYGGAPYSVKSPESLFPADAAGNTVFFDKNSMMEYKLYAMDKRNKQHIELKQFPCTVGKLAGCVDYVLADDSVSRIHARFDKQNEKVMLTDMNSTNGTYKNGLRMQPHETVEIEPGDEVRFGNLNYCYR
mgnify:CR=1 FL=1